MSVKIGLMQKSGIIVMKLAQEFMVMEVGDRIDTVANYSEKFTTARGTVQSALKLLEDNKAISIEARGHLGSFITYIDYKRILEYTDITSIVGVMPLPYSKLYEGLATGLYKSMEKSKLSFNLAYMRGAKSRIDAMNKGRYDFAIVSKLAAKQEIENGVNIDIVVEFGIFSYVSEHVLIFNDHYKRSIEDGMKIAIDRSSIDHSTLTLKQCQGKDVQLVELPYNQIVTKLTNGEIDAAVWNIDEIIEKKLNIKYYPLFDNELHNMDTEAVLVMNRNKSELGTFIKRFLNEEDVLKYQNKVVLGQVTPSY